MQLIEADLEDLASGAAETVSAHGFDQGVLRVVMVAVARAQGWQGEQI